MTLQDILAALFDYTDQDLCALPGPDGGSLHVWRVARLHEAAGRCRVEVVPLSRFSPTLKTWIGEDASRMSVADLAPHIRRVHDADLSWPILIGPDYSIIDGTHRFLKAHVEGHAAIRAAVFDEFPAPDVVVPLRDGKPDIHLQ